MRYDRGDSFPYDFLNQIELNLVQNQKENCHHDHIPFSVKANGNIVFPVCPSEILRTISRIYNRARDYVAPLRTTVAQVWAVLKPLVHNSNVVPKD